MVATNSGSPGCLSTAKEWLKSCEASHPDCHRINEDQFPLPTRVIKVGREGDNPSLFESKGQKGRWIALSYCWGGPSEFSLNDTNYASFIKGKPLDNFPPTIRDAIVTTRALDIEYLWVDALCIIQPIHNSCSDWEIEAPKMSQIYNNAALTIIAATSDSATSGIFADRDGYGNGMYRGTAYHFPWKRGAGDANSTLETNGSLDHETIIIRGGVLLQHHWAGPYTGDKSAWITRGWTTQEELLSWRTLAFMREEILWGCPSIQVWESGRLRLENVDVFGMEDAQVVQRVKPNLGHFKTEHATEGYYSSITGLRVLNTAEIYAAWYSMLENFSQRKFTRDTDKLMAIAGLAKDVQEYITDNYCAGLWGNDIIAGLIWTLDTETWADVELTVGPGDISPTMKWTGVVANSNAKLSSWSWASVNNPVCWRFKRATGKTTRQGDDVDQYSTAEEYIELARLEELKIAPSLSTHPGFIDSGELVVTAPSYSWSEMGEESRCTSLNPHHAFFLDELKEDDEFRARHREQPNQVYLIQQLARRTKTNTPIAETTWAVLVLQSVEAQTSTTISPNEAIFYRRLSLLFIQSEKTTPDWIEELKWSMKTARII